MCRARDEIARKHARPQQHQPEQSAMRNEVNLTALKLNAQGEGSV
jgi:hypothetical protein